MVAHACTHNGGMDGLGDVVDGPRFEALSFVQCIREGGGENDRYLRQGCILFEPAADLEATTSSRIRSG